MSIEQLRKAAQDVISVWDQYGTAESLRGWIDILRAALAQPQAEPYPLPDDLYPGSKDWRASDYAGRVAWLHAMYESARQELDTMYEALEKPQAEPTGDWVLVPRVPTSEMVNAMFFAFDLCDTGKRWDAALGAAPRATARMLSDEEINLIARDTVKQGRSVEYACSAAIRAFCKLNGIEVRDE